MNPATDLLQDVRTRLARLRDALEDGELDLAAVIAEDLEGDLAARVQGILDPRR